MVSKLTHLGAFHPAGDELEEAPTNQTPLRKRASFCDPKSIPGKVRLCFASLVQS